MTSKTSNRKTYCKAPDGAIAIQVDRLKHHFVPSASQPNVFYLRFVDANDQAWDIYSDDHWSMEDVLCFNDFRGESSLYVRPTKKGRNGVQFAQVLPVDKQPQHTRRCITGKQRRAKIWKEMNLENLHEIAHALKPEEKVLVLQDEVNALLEQVAEQGVQIAAQAEQLEARDQELSRTRAALDAALKSGSPAA